MPNEIFVVVADTIGGIARRQAINVKRTEPEAGRVQRDERLPERGERLLVQRRGGSTGGDARVVCVDTGRNGAVELEEVGRRVEASEPGVQGEGERRAARREIRRRLIESRP